MQAGRTALLQAEHARHHDVMSNPEPTERLPAGTTPWDPFNGIRAGGFAGALLGAFGAFLFPGAAVWLIVGGGVIGGTAGYTIERRRQRR